MKKNILVTGCAGFIGSAFIKSIIHENVKIIGIDDFSSGSPHNLIKSKKFKFYRGDCGEANTLSKIKDKVDFIYHFAGQSSGEKSFYNPADDAKRNLFATINLLEFYLRKKSKQFIYASSMAVYGDTYKKGVNEFKKPKPISFYGLAKYSSEKYISLFKKKGVNYTILRFFNVYGPGQRIGNLKQGLIRIYLTQIFKTKKLVIKGSLKRFRDFIYIDDVTNLLKKILNNKKSFNKVFDVSFGKKIYLSNLIKILKKKIKKKFRIIVKKGTPLDQFGIYSNSTSLKKINFTPKVNLANGVEKFILHLNCF